MRRIAPPLAVVGTGILLYLALHYYLWVRLISAPSLPGPVKLLATLVLVSLCAIPLFFGIFARLLGFDAPDTLQRIGYVWMGSYFLLAAAVGATDLLGLIIRTAHLAPPYASLGTPDGVAALGAGLGLVGIGLALWGGLRAPPVREVRLPTEGLPPALAGLTVVQLSDVHIGPTLGADFLAEVVNRVNALNPDLVAITGDLVDGSLEETAPLTLPLRGLKARLGVVYVPGNHEYYHGGPAWFTHLSALGLKVLRNQGLTLGEAEKAFYVAGVDDPTSRRVGGGGLDLKAALSQRPAGQATILLSHQPLGFEEAAADGVHLQLSGHTHGGQIFPFSLLVGLRYRFVAGLYKRGLSFLYVSRGTGYWGPPMRLGASSEITRLSFA